MNLAGDSIRRHFYCVRKGPCEGLSLRKVQPSLHHNPMKQAGLEVIPGRAYNIAGIKI